MNPLKKWACLGSLVLLAACGQNAVNSSPDAAASRDAGVGSAPDSALEALDAASTAPDAGERPDAQGSLDVGAAGDASGASDAGAAEAPDAEAPPGPDAATVEPPDASRVFVGCRGDPPAGASLPAAVPAYAGTCPALAPIPAENHLTSSGNDRTFRLVLPAEALPGERFALVFVWHWLQGSSSDVVEILQLQQAADQQRTIFVVPGAKGDLLFRWPFMILDSKDRVDEEVHFFDDLLSCVVAAHPEVNPGCVSSLGISAGALFNDQLAPRRSDRLASFVSLSGGVSGVARGWDGASRHLPGVVLWGGDGDQYNGLYDFASGSKDLENALTSEGELFVECIHNCGHAVPPFPVPPGGTLFQVMWDFVLEHPYWIAPGTSPWQTTGFPAGFPDWCGFGKGSAVPRTDPSGC